VSFYEHWHLQATFRWSSRLPALQAPLDAEGNGTKHETLNSKTPVARRADFLDKLWCLMNDFMENESLNVKIFVRRTPFLAFISSTYNALSQVKESVYVENRLGHMYSWHFYLNTYTTLTVYVCILNIHMQFNSKFRAW